MNRTLPAAIADFITHHGGLVSEAGGDALEYLAPKAFAGTLRIPEFGTLAFTPQPSGAPALYASYDSDFTRAIHAFLCGKGAVSCAVCPGTAANAEKHSYQILKTIGFTNATFRAGPTETRDIACDLVFFKYTAISDDRQEGLVAVLRNTINGCVSVVAAQALPAMLESMRDHPMPPLEDIEKSIRLSRGIAMTEVKRKTEDFVKSLEKRLNRDVQRIWEYYAQLTKETQKALARVEARQDLKEGQSARLRGKCEAIAAEKQSKIRDAAFKYALAIAVEPVILVRVSAPMVVLRINIQRRAQTRPFTLTYNPLLGQPDGLPCESCWTPRGERGVCDTRLHILCHLCLAPCPVCGKKYCKACYPNACPSKH